MHCLHNDRKILYESYEMLQNCNSDFRANLYERRLLLSWAAYFFSFNVYIFLLFLLRCMFVTFDLPICHWIKFIYIYFDMESWQDYRIQTFYWCAFNLGSTSEDHLCSTWCAHNVDVLITYACKWILNRPQMVYWWAFCFKCRLVNCLESIWPAWGVR